MDLMSWNPGKNLYCLLLPLFILNLSCKKEPSQFQEALSQFQLEEGLSIELVAGEPLVIDPVALAFDERRRLYVVENRGYPDMEEDGEARKLGRVGLLEDTDGDGQYDRRTDFAKGFSYPNGVTPWRGGVFITCAPDIYYLKDTTGDGVADLRKVVLTGFNHTKTTQIRMSSPTLGLDGWIYIAGGLNGGSVISPQYPDRAPVVFTAADGRFHPDTYEFQVTGGNSQFGLSFDSFGNRFGCSNRHPVQHIVLEPWHLGRNQLLSFSESIENVSQVEADATVFPISNTAITADFIPNLIGRSHKGTFTSACGILVFNGTGLASSHRGNIFICEPAQNLVQRQVLRPEMASFKSELAYEGKEFLASTDTWFNPVFLQHGPDGSLYLADMRRKVIDHPSYVPEEARSRMDFESGKTEGRIYRIRNSSVQNHPIEAIVSDAATPSADLVRALESPEEWIRSTAHRQLLEQSDRNMLPLIKQCAVMSPTTESRIRALWLLHSMDGLDAPTLKSLLSDDQSEVREQAVIVSEKFCKTSPEVKAALVFAAKDPSAKVRFNCALVLGSLAGPMINLALAQIAAQDGADRWTRAAILSGIGSRLTEFIEVFRRQPVISPPAYSAMMKDLGHLVGSGSSLGDCGRFFKVVLANNTTADFSSILGLATGISSRKVLSESQDGVLVALLGNHPAEVESTALYNFIQKAIDQAGNQSLSISERLPAIALLGYANFDRVTKVLKRLLDSRNPQEIQLEAITALARLGNSNSGVLLTEKSTWSGFTPRVKAFAIGVLLTKPLLTHSLLDAIEKAAVDAAEISPLERQRLLKSKDPQIKARAEVLLKDIEEGSRMQVYKNYLAKLNYKADAGDGKLVFMQRCGTCHTYDGEGGNVGPDLSGVNNQPVDALLLHTLVPNYEVYPAYQEVIVDTKDGRSLSGRIITETENSLTLKTAFGTDEAILRTNIISLTNTGRSLMPPGLEQNMTNDELSDLMAYLKSGGTK